MKTEIQIFSVILLIGVLSVIGMVSSCASNEAERLKLQENKIKVLSSECVNICPRGVKSFKLEYSTSDCQCRD